MDVVLMRLDAPMMSFGDVRVDNYCDTREHPALSMLTGLLGNALGYDHRDADRLQTLQDRLRFAVRQDSPGERFHDYQTVDLGQSFMLAGWTHQHRPEGRGGASGKETHLRHRWYLADAVYTVALCLVSPVDKPTLDDIEAALRHPERPLFLGRKACLPAAPVLLGRANEASLRDAVARAPWPGRLRRIEVALAWWPADEGGDDQSSHEFEISDERDWANQIHAGRRLMRQGLIRPEERMADVR